MKNITKKELEQIKNLLPLQNLENKEAAIHCVADIKDEIFLEVYLQQFLN